MKSLIKGEKKRLEIGHLKYNSLKQWIVLKFFMQKKKEFYRV